jgi:hypothetical protein
MTIPVMPEERADRLNRLLTVWLLRIAGACLFGLGVDVWIRLVGIHAGPLNRFDLMPIWWKIAAPALAVLYPVAGVGLWMTVSWGAVTWAILAAVEIVMHLVFPELFGGVTLLVVLHLSGLSMLLLLRLTGWWETRRRLLRRG